MAQAIDPVCGMTVATESAEHKSEYQGTTYYFCSPGCKRAFEKNPIEFVGQDRQGAGSGSMDHGPHH